MPAVFLPWYGASSAKCLLLWHHVLSEINNNTDIFLNQRINFTRITRQIFTIELHTVRRVAPQHRDCNVITEHCDVTSPYVYNSTADTGCRVIRQEVYSCYCMRGTVKYVTDYLRPRPPSSGDTCLPSRHSRTIYDDVDWLSYKTMTTTAHQASCSLTSLFATQWLRQYSTV